MSLDQIFVLAHLPAAIGWVALLVPLAALRLRLRIAMLCGAVLAASYVTFFFSDAQAAVLARNYSLTGIAAFFEIPHLRLAGWVHYLVLDLWAGIWETEQAHRRGMPQWRLTLSLALTAAAGPLGLLAFLLFRALSASGERTGSGASGTVG